MSSLHLKIHRELSHPYLHSEASSVKRAKSKSIQPSKFKFFQVSKQLAKLDDKLLKINPLVDFVPNDQRIKDTFQQYLVNENMIRSKGILALKKWFLRLTFQSRYQSLAKTLIQCKNLSSKNVD